MGKWSLIQELNKEKKDNEEHVVSWMLLGAGIMMTFIFAGIANSILK